MSASLGHHGPRVQEPWRKECWIRHVVSHRSLTEKTKTGIFREALCCHLTSLPRVPGAIGLGWLCSFLRPPGATCHIKAQSEWSWRICWPQEEGGDLLGHVDQQHLQE